MASLLSDSDSDCENKPFLAKNRVNNMSKDSSSDSDSDPSPPKQRRVGVRGVRGISRLLKQKSEGFAPLQTTEPAEKHCSFYSSAASLSLQAVEDGKFKVKGLNEKDVGEQDDKKQMIKGKVAARGSRKHKSPKKAPLIDLGDGDDEECSILESSQSQERDKSPTPPPTPTLPAKNKRKMKGVVAAIRTLDSVSATFRAETHGVEDDDDVCIIDMVSPTSARKQQDDKQQIVKVRSRSGIQRFTLKMTDEFSEVFRSMATHEFVSVDRISICHDDVPIQPYDTPACIKLQITDILDCYIQREAVSRDACAADDPDVITLQVQGNDPKSRRSININKREPLERMMRMYASQVRVPYDSLSFTFDGEAIVPSASADDLELEDDFCIDVAGL